MPRDYLQTNNSDLKLVNGDLVIGESSLQHQNDILTQQMGHDHMHPTVGVGSALYAKDDTTDNWFSNIRKQLRADGMTVKSIKLTATKLKIDAPYL